MWVLPSTSTATQRMLPLASAGNSRSVGPHVLPNTLLSVATVLRSATCCTACHAACSHFEAVDGLPDPGWYLHCSQAVLRFAPSAVSKTLQMPHCRLKTNRSLEHLAMLLCCCSFHAVSYCCVA